LRARLMIIYDTLFIEDSEPRALQAVQIADVLAQNAYADVVECAARDAIGSIPDLVTQTLL
jgi:hypothetical protein